MGIGYRVGGPRRGFRSSAPYSESQMRRGGSGGDRRRRVMVMESKAKGGGVGDFWAAASGEMGIAVGSCLVVGGNFILLIWLWACAVLLGPVEPMSKRPHEHPVRLFCSSTSQQAPANSVFLSHYSSSSLQPPASQQCFSLTPLQQQAPAPAQQT